MRIRALLREVTHIPLNTKQFTPVDQVVISNLEQPVKRGGKKEGIMLHPEFKNASDVMTRVSQKYGRHCC